MDIWIPVLVALVTSALSFMASTMKSSKNLQAVKLENESKLEQIKQQHRDDLEKQEKENQAAIKKMETEVELKLKEYSGTKGTDITYDFMGTLLQQAQSDPQKAIQSIQGIQALSDWVKTISREDKDTK